MGDSFEERRWLARVRDPRGTIQGAAWLVDDRHLVTCAHVVTDAGGKPGTTVRVEFPLLDDSAPRDATVLPEAWVLPAGTAGDIAVLVIDDPPMGAEPAPIRRRRSLRGRTFDAYGFPPGYDDSGHTSGTLGVAVGRQWVQAEATSGLLAKPGFSGGVAWSAELGGVVAMLVTRDTGSGGRVAFAIPVAVLADTSPVIRASLPTALELDPDLETHWLPRALGGQRAGANSSVFTGRQRALGELVAWLADDGHSGLRLVTGGPGTGKSAVLARLVCLVDPHQRRRRPERLLLQRRAS